MLGFMWVRSSRCSQKKKKVAKGKTEGTVGKNKDLADPNAAADVAEVEGINSYCMILLLLYKY